MKVLIISEKPTTSNAKERLKNLGITDSVHACAVMFEERTKDPKTIIKKSGCTHLFVDDSNVGAMNSNLVLHALSINMPVVYDILKLQSTIYGRD